MLTDHELEQLFATLRLPDKARDLIRRIRIHGPVRKPNPNLGTSLAWYPSQKMAGHVYLESRTGEVACAALYEDDPSVLEYWPQPHRMHLTLRDAAGKVITKTPHTPDFLVLRGTGVGFEEHREESRLAEASGWQFYRDNDHHWHYRAAEDYASSLGMHHRIISSISIPRALVDNVEFLKDYFDPSCPPLSPDTHAKLTKLLSERGYARFTDLLDTDGFTSDEIFNAVANNVAFVPLGRQRLALTDEVVIYRDRSVARAHMLLTERQVDPLPIPGMGVIRAGVTVTYGGRAHNVILASGSEVLLQDEQGNRNSVDIKDIEAIFDKVELDGGKVRRAPANLADIPTKRLDMAVERLHAVEAFATSRVPLRTKQRWKQVADGQPTVADKIIALAGTKRPGNTTPRLCAETEEVAKDVIEHFYNTPTCRTRLAAYHEYLCRCEARGTEHMSYPSFCKRIKCFSSVKKREGKRKAYQVTPIPLLLDYRHPVHGVRPHEVCYIDHTILTIATRGVNGSDLGKPIFTLATDGHTTQARAFYLSYDPPSARVVLMTLRDYVRRHHRLPSVLVVDGGREFRSAELKFFCKIYGIEVRFRRQGKPRDGGPIERALGSTETELIAQLQGNTRIMRNARMVTKSVDPFQFREWTLTALWGALDEYLFSIRNDRVHPSLGVSPGAYERMRLAETGVREHRLIRFDESIMLATCPHAKRWHHKVDPQRGIWVDNMYYWHSDFSTARKDELAEVRVEPWNANVIYAQFRDRWIAAIARDLRHFGRRSRYEVELALRAERKMAKTMAHRSRIGSDNAKKMRRLWRPEQFDERINQQQTEMAHLYDKVRMGMTMNVPLPETRTRISDGVTEEASSAAGRQVTQPTAVAALGEPSMEGYANSNTNLDDTFWGSVNGYV